MGLGGVGVGVGGGGGSISSDNSSFTIVVAVILVVPVIVGQTVVHHGSFRRGGCPLSHWLSSSSESFIPHTNAL